MVSFEDQVEEHWAKWRVQRNRRSAQLVLWLVIVLYPLFGILDYLTVPADGLPVLYTSRVIVTICTLVMFRVVKTQFFVRNSTVLTATYMVLVASGISVMIFQLGGYASPYYAGLNLVMIAAGLLYLWPMKVAMVAHATIVATYVFPNAATASSVDMQAGITNLFFLGATAVTVVVAHVFSFRTQREQVVNQLMLERAKADREQALQKLQELDRAKSQFFSNITHELRTPLTLILSPLESILSGELGRFRADQMLYLRNVWKNALKLLKLINNLLDLAKIEEKFLKLDARKSDIVDLLRDIADHSRPLAARKNITLQLHADLEPTDLHIDVEKMERVVVNLLSNALKFTEPGGEVVLSLDQGDEGWVDISVRDTGVGIPADKLETIFERFSQADASTTRRFGGTGIGLAFAREIVELHGGRISVRSTPGEGSVFTVHLQEGTAHLPTEFVREEESTADASVLDESPAREWSFSLTEDKQYRFHDIEEATERRIAERGDDSMKSTKILVVEDTVEILRFIHIQLQEEHAVYLALNGRLGLDLAKREMPDVIVTDYMMPEMDGVQMICALREDPKTADIPIIMLTAKNSVEDRLKAHGAGADVYLNKPFSPRELRTVIAKQLERRGRQATTLMKAHVKSLEIISAGLAHEIHNPLSYIKNAHFVVVESLSKIEAALKNPDLSDAQRTKVVERSSSKLTRMTSVAERGIQRIEQIVQLVRRYAREGYPEEPTELALDAAISDVVALIAPKSDQDVRLHTELATDSAAVLCIPEELQQVVRNIVQNAFDAVGEAGNVWVRTRRDGHSVDLEVADDGPGIAQENMARIFAPFFSTKAPGKGMGVGLAIAHQVVTQAGGSIDVRNNPGRGATFRIRLPVVAEPLEIRSPTLPDAPPSLQPPPPSTTRTQ